jgi:hypothetical protein
VPGKLPSVHALTDIHIVDEHNSPKYTILGVRGVSPNDPGAHFGVIGQGGAAPQIINLRPTVNAGETITIRVQVEPGLPQDNTNGKRFKYMWSYEATAGGVTVRNKVIETQYVAKPDGT